MIKEEVPCFNYYYRCDIGCEKSKGAFAPATEWHCTYNEDSGSELIPPIRFRYVDKEIKDDNT